MPARSTMATALAALALAGGTAGCGALDAREGRGGAGFQLAVTRPPVLPAAAARKMVHAESPDEERLLAAILVGLGSSSVTKVSLGDVPEDWAASRELEASGDRWLVIEVESGHVGSAYVRASWEASLVAGAFRDRAHAAGLGDVLGYTTVVRYPDGTSRTGANLITGSFDNAVDERGPEALARALHARLEAARGEMGGIRRAEISFRRPFAYALVLELDVVDVRKAWAYVARNDIFGMVEGRLLEVRNEAGEPIVVSGGGARTRTGRLWVRSDYVRRD